MQKEESKEKNRIYNDYSHVCSRKRKERINTTMLSTIYTHCSSEISFFMRLRISKKKRFLLQQVWLVGIVHCLGIQSGCEVQVCVWQGNVLSIVSRLLSPLAVEKQAFAVLAVLFQVGKQAIGVLRRLCFIKASFSLYYRIERIKRALSSPICLSHSLQWWCREGSLALQSF